MPWRVHGKSGHASAQEFAQRCDAMAACLADPDAQAPAWLAGMVEAASAQALRAEVQQLKERIQVLERVITDERKSIDLDREIERLRDR